MYYADSVNTKSCVDERYGISLLDYNEVLRFLHSWSNSSYVQLLFFAATTGNQNEKRDMRPPVPGCVVLGVAGSVDSADVEQQKKQRLKRSIFRKLWPQE